MLLFDLIYSAFVAQLDEVYDRNRIKISICQNNPPQFHENNPAQIRGRINKLSRSTSETVSQYVCTNHVWNVTMVSICIASPHNAFNRRTINIFSNFHSQNMCYSIKSSTVHAYSTDVCVLACRIRLGGSVRVSVVNVTGMHLHRVLQHDVAAIQSRMLAFT